MLTQHSVSDVSAATDWVVTQMRAMEPGPFDRPVVLAEHPAQWRAITMALATDSGCFASVRLLTPTGWVDETLKLEGERREWRPRAMTWRIVDAIVARLDEMPPTARRIVEANDGVALHEFARQVAERFWDYLRYRPELPLAWEQGDALESDAPDSEAWQRALWRELCARTQTTSPAQRIAEIRREGVTLGDDVPPVVHVIAGARIPPVTQELLERIAERRDVHWCSLALASGVPTARTVTLSACHSELREIETLRERLVQAMHEDPTLRPEDVTLYLSDVTTYAPAVEAVFDVDEPGMPHIPYSIAGRPFREASPVVRTVLQLVDVADGRGTLDEIGGLLRLEPVARAAGFDDEDVTVALDLATRAGITWGRDAATRAQRHGLPEVAGGTWQHGIDRLVLGVATGRTPQPVDEILPVAGDTGGNAELIGRLAAWSERVFALCDAMQAAATAAEWTVIIERVLREFVSATGGDDAEAARNVRAALQAQLEAIAEATPGLRVNLATIRALLSRALEERGARMGHLRGGLRVCRLEPGTVLPARVVLMAGFDDALHPGGGGSLSWDLLQHTPSVKAVGEDAAKARRQRDPDRRAAMLEAFAQAVCSARDAVHVAWTGYTLTKQEERAASVAVASLMERVGVEAERQAAHPFSPSLFEVGGTGLRSAAAGWAQAALAIVEDGDEPPAFGATPLPDATVERLSLEDLTAAVYDPTRYFCQRVLGLRVFDDDDTLADAEPMGIAPTKKDGSVVNDFRSLSWRIEESQRRGELRSERALREWIRHQPELAYGEEGARVAEVLAHRWWPEVNRWREQWRPVQPFELALGGVVLTGRLDRLTADARVIHSLYELKESTTVKHWVTHLVLNALAAEGHELPTTTRFTCRAPYTLEPVADAREILLDLVRLHMEATRAPLPLHRKSSIAFLLTLDVKPLALASDDIQAFARRQAAGKWQGNDSPLQFTSECDEEWNRLCWAERSFVEDDAVFARFAEYAERVYLPFLLASTMPRKGRK